MAEEEYKSRQERIAENELQESIRLRDNAEYYLRLYFEDMETLLEKAKLHTDFVIDQALPEQGIGIIAGRPESRKSWLAYDAAIAVARGRPWLGFDVPQKGPAMILNFDNPPQELRRRLLRMGVKPNDRIICHSPAAHLPIAKRLPAALHLPMAMQLLMRLIDHVQPRIVVVDSYRQSHTLEEHSSADMAFVMSCFKQLTWNECAVLIVHHLRKRPADKKKGGDDDDEEPLRGSVEIEASADSIMLTEPGLLKLHKTRGWRPTKLAETFIVEDYNNDTRTRILAKYTMAALVSVLEKGPLTRKEIRKQLGLEQSASRALVDKAIEDGIVREAKRSDANATRYVELIEEEEDDD